MFHIVQADHRSRQPPFSALNDEQHMDPDLSSSNSVRPFVTRKVKTWLPDSRVSYSSLVDHRNEHETLYRTHS